MRSRDGKRLAVINGGEMMISGEKGALMDVRLRLLRILGLPKGARVNAFVFQ
jgi:hypothetical protein